MMLRCNFTKMITKFLTLLRLEWKLEFRERSSVASVLLFVVATIYLFSIAFGSLEIRLWNATYWLIILLAATNGLSTVFKRELTYRHSYYAQLAEPLSLFFSKVVINFLYLIVVSLLGWGVLSLFFGNPVKDEVLWLTTIFASSLGFSLILCFLALIAGRVRNGPTLVALLAFPVLIPLLLTVIKLGAVSVRLIQQTSTMKDLLILGGIDLLAIGLSLFLVPLLWQDA